MRKIVSKFFWPAFEVVIAGIFVVLVMPRNKDEKLMFTVENSDAVKMIDTTSKFFVDDILIDTEDKKEEVVEAKQEEVRTGKFNSPLFCCTLHCIITRLKYFEVYKDILSIIHDKYLMSKAMTLITSIFILFINDNK